MMNQSNESMSLGTHLTELRRRLVIVILTLVVGAGVAIFFSKHIYSWLQIPLIESLSHGSKFITLSPVEGWLVYFKVSLVAAIFVTSPVWLYQFWAFIAPGLYKQERFVLFLMGVISALLFIGGALLCYYLVIPQGFKYFVSVLENTDISLLPEMGMYFSFMLRLLLAFGIVFEIPLLIIFLVRWNVVSLARLRKARPYVVLIAFVLAAMITPPDVFTQIALAIPFIILFELSLVVSWIMQRRGQ